MAKNVTVTTHIFCDVCYTDYAHIEEAIRCERLGRPRIVPLPQGLKDTSGDSIVLTKAVISPDSQSKRHIAHYIGFKGVYVPAHNDMFDILEDRPERYDTEKVFIELDNGNAHNLDTGETLELISEEEASKCWRGSRKDFGELWLRCT